MGATLCPSRHEIARYLLGTLPPSDAEKLSDHLDDCPTCENTAQALETVDDSFIAKLRQPTIVAEAFTDEPGFRQACANLTDSEAHASDSPNQSELDSQNVACTALARIGQYELLEMLGQGGMGAVFKARHTKLGRTVAIKLLPSERVRDGQALARFEREMRAIGKLDHHHIVRASDAGEFNGQHFLVMEFVDGVDLSKLSRRNGPLPIADACELVRQAAMGVQYIHEHGLVHRDIKPSNLMLAVDGNRAAPNDYGDPRPQKPTGDKLQSTASVKILDLGLALLGGELNCDELTNTGQLMGTLDYMAPEQADDSHEVDIRADIYGLGATLYKLLCNQAPFSGQHYQTLRRKFAGVLNERPKPIRERRTDLPDELAQVIERMMAKHPADRFATPAQVAVALAPFTMQANLLRLAAEDEQLASPPDMLSNLVSDAPPKNDDPSLAALQLLTGKPVRSKFDKNRIPRGWRVAGAILAMTLFGCTIYVATDAGRLEIQSNVSDVKVSVSQNGQEVAILDLATGSSVRLRSGNYELTLKGNRNDVLIQRNFAQITRGGHEIVRITQSQIAGNGGMMGGGSGFGGSSLASMVGGPTGMASDGGYPGMGSSTGAAAPGGFGSDGSAASMSGLGGSGGMAMSGPGGMSSAEMGSGMGMLGMPGEMGMGGMLSGGSGPSPGDAQRAIAPEEEPASEWHQVAEFNEFEGSIHHLTFSPNGRWLAVCTSGKAMGDPLLQKSEMRIYDTRSWALHGDVGDVGFIMNVEFGPDSKYVAFIATKTESTYVAMAYDILARESRKQLTISTSKFGVVRLAVTEVERLVEYGIPALDAGVPLQIWDWKTGNRMGAIEKGSHVVKFSPDGKFLAVAAAENSQVPYMIAFYDANTGAQVRTFGGQPVRIQFMEFSPDGKYLAASALGSVIALFDVASGKLHGALDSQFAGAGIKPDVNDIPIVTALAFTSDSKRITSVVSMSGKTNPPEKPWLLPLVQSWPGTFCHSWDVKSGMIVSNLPLAPRMPGHIQFAADGRAFVETGGGQQSYKGDSWSIGDNTVRLWDINTRRPLTKFKNESAITKVAISPDCNTIVTSHVRSDGGRGVVTVWAPKPE